MRKDLQQYHILGTMLTEYNIFQMLYIGFFIMTAEVGLIIVRNLKMFPVDVID